jgi:glycogen debranching enzyme
MVLFAEQLATIADLLGKKEAAEGFRKEAAQLKLSINEKMWNAKRKFYFDLTVDGRQSSAKTIAGFWTLLAGVASPEQADALAAELRNPNSFGRRHRVPTTPADQEGFDPAGGYWRGSVWAPTNTMVIRGLERYGKHELAREIALEHLQRMGEVFQTTGTVWENYSPDRPVPGTPSKSDFVGWSGIGPILYFLEYAIGLCPDAPSNRLTWTLDSAKRCGCQRYRFNGHVATLTAEPPADSAGTWRITVESDGPFDLTVKRGGRQSDFSVEKGTNSFSLDR